MLSRTAILDIFVMFWVLAAFGMLVLDRDASRARLADLVDSGQVRAWQAAGPSMGVRWRRVLAGVFLGLACGTKWNGIWYVLAFAALATAWDLGARRAAGYSDRIAGVLRGDVIWLPVSFGRCRSLPTWPPGADGSRAARWQAAVPALPATM